MDRMTALLLLLWAGATVSTVLDLQKRIIGGQTCKKDERKYHVKLIGSKGTRTSFCGGSLISKQWILTAAHCKKPGWVLTAFVGVHPGPGTPQVITHHVIYQDNDGTHDIMLLKLSKPVTDIAPVPLPDCKDRPKVVEIAGHAATSGGPNDERKPGYSPTLHCADIEVVDCKDLENTLEKHFWKAYKVKVYQHWFCGQTPTVDICYGDSGGGVVYKDKIYGVISFLGDPGYVCRKATAFMDLCNPDYATWISQTIT